MKSLEDTLIEKYNTFSQWLVTNQSQVSGEIDVDMDPVEEIKGEDIVVDLEMAEE